MIPSIESLQAKRLRFNSVADYRAAKAKAHGFHTWVGYQADLAIRKRYPQPTD